MATGVIDQFFVALGFRVDPTGAKELKKRTEEARQSLLSLGTAVKVALGGFAVKAIIDVNNAFEKNTIAISSFLEALDLSKAGQGMADAAKTMESIETAAAKLPGEAEDYIEVFRAGLPVLKGAMPGGSLSAMTDFTNRFAAIGNMLKVDAGQIGRDLSLLLGPTGRAGANVLTFQRMLPFIQRLKGHAKETAESFNRLTQPQRLALLQEALASPGLTAGLDRAANSFDALFGSAKSALNKFIREASVELFPGLKAGLEKLTATFIDGKGKLTPFGHEVVEVVKKIGTFIKQTAEMVGGLLDLARSSAAGKLALAGLAAGLLGVKKVLKGGLLTAIVLIAEDLYTFFQGGESVTGMLLEKFPKASKVAIAAIAGLGAAFVTFKVGALLQMSLVAAGAKTAGAAVGRGFTAALGPIGAIFAGLTLLWQLLDEADEKFDWVNKVSNFLVDLGIMGPRTTEPDALKAMNVQQGFKRFDPNAPPAFLAKPLPKTAASMAPWNPAMSAPPTGSGVVAPGGAPTVNIGDVTIKSDNPRDAGRNFMNTIRDAQSKESH